MLSRLLRLTIFPGGAQLLRARAAFAVLVGLQESDSVTKTAPKRGPSVFYIRAFHLEFYRLGSGSGPSVYKCRGILMPSGPYAPRLMNGDVV